MKRNIPIPNRPGRWLGNTLKLTAALALGLMLPAGANAAVSTWSGATSGDWGTAGNWDVAFANGADVVFTGSANPTTFLGANARTVNSITFSSGAGAGFSVLTASAASGGSTRTLTFGAANAGITIEAGNTFANQINGLTGGSASFINLSGNLTITHNGSGTFTITRPIYGSFGVTKAGSGTFIYSGPPTYGTPNPYAGNTTISAGTLQLGAANVIPDGTGKGNVIVDGTFDLNAKAETINGLSGNGLVDNTLAGTPTLTVGNNNQTTTFGGTIQNTAGTLALTKTGSGVLTLSGTNTYGGATTVNAGKLVGVVGGSASNSAAILNNAAAILAVSITDNTKQWTYASFNAAAVGALEFNFGAAPSVSLAPLQITGTAIFTNTPTVTIVGASLSVGTFPLMTWASTSGTPPSVVSLPSGVTGSLSVSGNTLNLVITVVEPLVVKDNNVDNLNLGSSWVGGVTPDGTKTAQWNNTVAADNTTVLGADLTWKGISIANPNGLVTIDAGNTLTLGAGSTDIDMTAASTNLTLNCGLLAGAANVWDVASDRTLTLNGVVSGASSITKQGLGTVTLAGVNTFTGGFSMNAGTLNLNNNAALGDVASTFTIAGGALDNTLGSAVTLANNNPQAWNTSFTFNGSYNLDLGTGAVTLDTNRTVTVLAGNLTVGGPIGGGAVRLTKAGAGALTLAGANTLSGGVTLNAGTLNLNNASALGATAGAFTITGGSIDTTAGTLVLANNNPQLWNGNFAFVGTADLDLGTGPVTLNAARTVTVNGGGGRNLTVGGVISGAFGLAKDGARNLVLNGLNTFTGALTIGNGTVKANTIANAGVASSLGAASGANSVVILGSGGTGTLEYTGSTPASTDRQMMIGRNANGTDNSGIANNNADAANTLTFVNASFNQPVTGNISTTGPRTLTLSGSNPGKNTIQGIIAENAGSGGAANNIVNITKTGAGTWVLAGANTYTGPTTVNGGKLIVVVGGSSANSAVMMPNAGATFSVTVANNTQSWTCANLTNTAGGTLEFDFGINTPSVSVAPLVITGQADFTASAPTINILGDFIPVGTYPLMTWATTSGTPPSTVVLPAGAAGNLNVNGSTLELVVTTGTPVFTKANNATSLDQTSSWVNSVVPTATDTPWWDSTVTGPNTTVLGVDTAWKRIRITNPNGLVTISSGNTLTLSSPDKEIDMTTATANLTLNCPLILPDANVWDVNTGTTLTLGGQVSGAASVTKQGDGIATLSAANTYTGNTTIKAGTLALSGAGTLGTGASAVALTGGALDLGAASKSAGAVSITAPAASGDTIKNGSLTGTAYTAAIASGDAVISAKLLASGGIGLTKSGAGTLTLANTNTYTGLTAVNNGTLRLAGSSILPPANAISVGAATLAIRNDNAGTINHGDLNVTATGATVDIGNNGGATTGSTVAFGNFATPAGATQTATTFIGANGYNLSFASLSLPGSSGQTTTLTPNGTSIIVTGNVTNRMNGFATNNWDTLVLAGDSTGNQILGVIANATGTNTAGQSASLANGGTTRLTKNGNGTWTLTGASTYTGVTTVSAGTLLVNGSVASPTNNVNGGILGGNGTLSGLVNVAAAGTIQPGAGSTTTLTVNNSLTLAGTAVFVLNRTNAQNSSRIAGLTSRDNTGGTLTVNNIGPAIQVNDTFTLFSGAAGVGDFAVTNLPSIAPLTWNLDTVAGTLTAVSGVATNPTNISYTISGNQLTMTWPADHLGWYAQSNSVNLANTNFWFDVPNSQLATNLVITISPTQTNVFYRLRNP